MEFFLDKFESFVGVNFWTMIFAWINLLILYLVLRKLLFGKVAGMIDARQKEIDGIYTDAEEKKTEAEALKAEYEEKIKSANEESEEILKRASRKALLREEEIIKEANEKAKRTLERANEEIEREKINAINEVKDEVSSIAIDIASSIIGREISKEENEAMIDEFIANMGESK